MEILPTVTPGHALFGEFDPDMQQPPPKSPQKNPARGDDHDANDSDSDSDSVQNENTPTATGLAAKSTVKKRVRKAVSSSALATKFVSGEGAFSTMHD